MTSDMAPLDGSRTDKGPDGATSSGRVFQRQIADALGPLVAGVQRQLAQVAREQVDQALAPLRAPMRDEVDRTLDPVRTALAQHIEHAFDVVRAEWDEQVERALAPTRAAIQRQVGDAIEPLLRGDVTADGSPPRADEHSMGAMNSMDSMDSMDADGQARLSAHRGDGETQGAASHQHPSMMDAAPTRRASEQTHAVPTLRQKDANGAAKPSDGRLKRVRGEERLSTLRPDRAAARPTAGDRTPRKPSPAKKPAGGSRSTATSSTTRASAGKSATRSTVGKSTARSSMGASTARPSATKSAARPPNASAGARSSGSVSSSRQTTGRRSKTGKRE